MMLAGFLALLVIAGLCLYRTSERPTGGGGWSTYVRCGDCGAVLGLSEADLPRLMTGPWQHRCPR